MTWDLGDLYAGVDDPAILRDLEALAARAGAFGRHRGAIARKDPGAKQLLEIIIELERIAQDLGRLYAYASLVFAADSQNPAHGALVTRVQEAGSDIRAQLLFFELEWIALEDDTANALLNQDCLAPYRHHLSRERLFKPHRRTEGEEIILDAKNNTGAHAFARLFDETMARLRFDVTVNGEVRQLSEQETLTLLYDADRECRKAAADALTQGLTDNLPLLGFVFNTLMADHAGTDKIRAFPDPMASRNLGNEIQPEAVQALLAACEGGFALVHDYYRIKGDLLRLHPLYDYDRYAPIGEGERIAYPDAKGIVLDSFASFSPRMAEIARMFFERRWIDAAVREGKQGGAFSHPTVPSVHPYVLMNYQGRARDVMTLAHELGHGVHQFLARQQGYFGADTPLTTAETASVFGEMLVFSALRERTQDPQARLALLCGKLEDTFSTVFRQVVMTRFEQAVHHARRTEGELPPERIGALWMEANRPMFGDALVLRDGYATWWSYIPHFVHTPFYCYAYAFGELLVLSLYARYLEEGPAFVPRYLEMLAAGGTDRPDRLMARIGVDISAPGFWERGIAIIADWVGEARALTDAVSADRC